MPNLGVSLRRHLDGGRLKVILCFSLTPVIGHGTTRLRRSALQKREHVRLRVRERPTGCRDPKERRAGELPHARAPTRHSGAFGLSGSPHIIRTAIFKLCSRSVGPQPHCSTPSARGYRVRERPSGCRDPTGELLSTKCKGISSTCG